MEDYNIVFKMSEELCSLYLTHFNMDISKVNSSGDWLLPIPATFVIDKDMKVIASYVSEDYTQRVETSDIIQSLRSL